jgi:hypothetical protein
MVKSAKAIWTAPAGRTALVMGSNCWGQGADAKIALRNCKAEAPSYAKKFVLIDAPKNFNIHPVDGSVEYKPSDGRPVRVGELNARGELKSEVNPLGELEPLGS